jgi:hypothetical protein
MQRVICSAWADVDFAKLLLQGLFRGSFFVGSKKKVVILPTLKKEGGHSSVKLESLVRAEVVTMMPVGNLNDGLRLVAMMVVCAAGKLLHK